MNDTFLSIENATGVAGWEIRAGLPRFPLTGWGAHLTTCLLAIKKMTDATGDTWSLSSGLSLNVSLDNLFLIWNRYWLYLITDEKLPFPLSKPDQDSSTLTVIAPDSQHIYEDEKHSCYSHLLFHNCLWPLMCTFILHWWSIFLEMHIQ